MPPSREFAPVLKHLRDSEQPFPGRGLYQFSDLARADLAALKAAWPGLPLARRRGVIADLSEIGEANYEVNFDAVFRLALDDDDADVRAGAIGGLWESEDPALAQKFIDILTNDPAPLVRAGAASGLGRFVYLGEVDELPADDARRVEDTLLAVVRGSDDAEVRRRALEALSYSGREEVAGLIAEFHQSPDVGLRVSAVFGMGRSSDPRWQAPVMAELENPLPEIRFEAVRAAGELEIEAAAPLLASLVEDDDPQISDAAIWSLSQVGGPIARETLLRLLAEAETSRAEDQADFVGEALENLDFTDGLHDFSLLEVDADEGDDAARGAPSP